MPSNGDLRSLLERATPYEAWRAPLDETLRRGVYMSAASTVLGLVVIMALPGLHAAGVRSAMILQGPMVGLLRGVATFSPLLGAMNLFAMALHLVLLVVTRGWLEGRPLHHWAAGGMTVVGALNAFIVAMGLSLFLLNLVVMALVGIAILIMLVVAFSSG